MANPFELPKNVALEWRKFVGTPAFEIGIQYLRRTRSTGTGSGDMEIVKGAHQWKGYQEALDDLVAVLTALPTKDAPTEEPPLGG